MKTIAKFLVIASCGCLMFTVAAFGDPCDEGQKLFNHALTKAPDEMTVEYLDSALEMCPDHYSLFKTAAGYYKKWAESTPDPKKQANYKELAIDFYQKSLDAGNTQISELQAELNRLKGSRSFNKIAFRALKPSQPGVVNSGLDIHINFKRNSYELMDDLSILDELGEVLKEDGRIRISLEGHTDKTGTLDYNNDLSVHRAAAVKSYIVKKFDIDPSRMLVTGYGFKYLLDKNNPDGAKNRRVEVIKLSD